MVVTVIIFYLVSTRSVFGRSVYSVGGNEEASRLSGIPVGRTRITIFAITGLMVALSGIITASRIMAGAWNVAQGLEFEVIAAVVIGGTSLAGGSGSMIGTFLGVLFIGLLSNGMTLMGVDFYWQQVARGLIVLIAVLISVWQKPIKR
jgi:simple sugar transport system permease protein